MTVTVSRRRVKIMENTKPAVKPMDETHRAIVAPKVGRKKVPSIFNAEVQAAINTGNAYVIDIPEGMKPATILSELDKAAKELHVKLKKWKRETIPADEAAAGVVPFVGFQVVAPLAEQAPVTSSMAQVPLPTSAQLLAPQQPGIPA